MQVHSTLELLEDVMADLYQAVDSRVFVSVGRGLWDCASQDVYDYLEGLLEGLGLNKVQSLHPHLFLFALQWSLAGRQQQSFLFALCTSEQAGDFCTYVRSAQCSMWGV